MVVTGYNLWGIGTRRSNSGEQYGTTGSGIRVPGTMLLEDMLDRKRLLEAKIPAGAVVK